MSKRTEDTANKCKVTLDFILRAYQDIGYTIIADETIELGGKRTKNQKKKRLIKAEKSNGEGRQIIVFLPDGNWQYYEKLEGEPNYKLLTEDYGETTDVESPILTLAILVNGELEENGIYFM